MHTLQMIPRIHPLVAGAAASVMLVSLLGAAAITGILPNSQGSVPQAQTASAPAVTKTALVAQTASTENTALPAIEAPRRKVSDTRQSSHMHRHGTSYAASSAQPVYAPSTPPLAQASTQPSPAVQAAPAVQSVPEPKPTTGIGIATGAVVGGLLGNQIGGGSGRKLATIAGVIGGGYLGNEIEKRAR